MSERETSGTEPILLIRDERGGWVHDPRTGGIFESPTSYGCQVRMRRAPEGWLAAAVERVKRLLGTQSYAASDNSGGIRVRTVDDDEIRAAILGPAPEPEEWIRKLADDIVYARHPKPEGSMAVDNVARHIARALAARKAPR
ncbi:MAG TPA: hypothetical protein VJP77_05840 [Planctomycetota bacterium]|nr:hypothetical protein [Planctomycetota bacterium]